MTRFLVVLQYVMTVLPALVQAIRLVEEAMPEAGKGSTKLALVMAGVEAVHESAKEVAVTFQEVRPVLESTVSKVVGLFNAVGVFRK